MALWNPDKNRHTHAQHFMQRLDIFSERIDTGCHNDKPSFHDLYDWSIAHPKQFWAHVWDYCEVISSGRGERTLINADRMIDAQWFPDAKLNYAENLLRRRDDHPAIIFFNENKQRVVLSYKELHRQVGCVAAWMKNNDLKEGDRVAAFVPNIIQSIVAMLATASLGGVWSSCSPDFGVNGVLDRFKQIRPTFFITADGYYYNGKTHDCLDRAAQIKNALPTVTHTLVIPYVDAHLDRLPTTLQSAEMYTNIIADKNTPELRFRSMPFNAALFILFSSGTTGVPKCIVHSIGGTLLQHLKEHQLHCNLKNNQRIFYYTTCGWMMWNWLVSALASNATVLLYDGSPFYPDDGILFDFVSQEKAIIMGVSAKYIDACRNKKMTPHHHYDLSSLQQILSTGSPLVEESFDYVYSEIKSDVCLSSLSGGTDILSCFALGSADLAVNRGELQSRGLGMQVEVWDAQGNTLAEQKGELVCTKPFPCMPVGFWNDPQNRAYEKAYFSNYDNIWCHGDYVELTANKGMVFYGRSDAVLNPGGVRIGTAEIYRQVETLDAIEESIVVGQRSNGDIRVILFVKLNQGFTLDSALQNKIRLHIRNNTTPRHVPAEIVLVNDIPRTKSGKIVELAVQKAIHDEVISNRDALANPEALDEYYVIGRKL